MDDNYYLIWVYLTLFLSFNLEQRIEQLDTTIVFLILFILKFNNMDINKKYNIIYSDPWTFTTRSDKGKGKSPENHYNCMSLKDICNLPVNNIAEKDCVLFMWVVDPLLHKAFEVIRNRTEYKTVAFTWAKQNRKSPGFFTGLGYWTRGNPEMCLLATKGRPKRLVNQYHN